jgi:site-specific recombinase XerD
VGVRSEHTLRSYWRQLHTFARFVAETRAVSRLSDVGSVVLVRYLEWLNRQVGRNGKPWRAVTRSSPYSGLRTLLRWL